MTIRSICDHMAFLGNMREILLSQIQHTVSLAIIMPITLKNDMRLKMKKISTLLCGALFVSHAMSANVVNGDFENWTGGIPDDWTTIDSGISVSQSTSQIQNGSSSAAIIVNTGTQGSTDFRQTVGVTGGEIFEASVWVRHTEGGVKARLYVNGYQGYSNPGLINQWQQITYSYTPGTSANIEVGLRFYDVVGFDGSESVYVDNFQPSTISAPTGCILTTGSLSLTTDNYGAETSWQITDSQSIVVESGTGYASNTTYNQDLCLGDGNYVFTINDTYGDGICCQYGSGNYSLSFAGQTVASGGTFASSEATAFSIGAGSGGGLPDLSTYYASANGLTGYALKTELYNIIKGHVSQGYGALWNFYSANELDSYYENDGSILDIYSERPTSNDPYNFAPVSAQCGNYSGEGDCYNREHSFPRSWFGGTVEPMNSDVHHIFASDGFVNSKRGSFPYGKVGTASFTSQNGSLLGSASVALGYTGTVFEPIDEFKGDLARAYFYMATRYENAIGGWQGNSTSADAVLNGSSNQVFEVWVLAMLKSWHQQDPVSAKELARNEAAHSYQGNRNPFVDYPEFVSVIWGN